MTGSNMTESTPSENNWKRMSFKGNKVWVAFTSDGIILENNNKVLIKYNLNQDYEYWIKKGICPCVFFQIQLMPLGF